MKNLERFCRPMLLLAVPRNKLQPYFTSLTETSLHEPLTDHKIVRTALGTVTVCSTVGSTVHTLEVLTESPDTFLWRVPYLLYLGNLF